MWIRGIVTFLLFVTYVLGAAALGDVLQDSPWWVMVLATIGVAAGALLVMNPIYNKLLEQECDCE